MPVIEDVCDGLKVYRDLTRRELSGEGLFICESLPAIEAALAGGLEPVSLLMEKRHVGGKAAKLVARLNRLPVYAPPDEVIARITGVELSRGVLAAFKRPPERDAEDVIAASKRLCVLENVRDDTNMGAIFRNAAALGIDAVLLTRASCDPLSRRSIRVSMGAVFRLPFALIGDLPQYGISLLRRHGFTACALALVKDSVPIEAFHAPKPAYILGNEGEGLTRDTLEACDVRAIIPMERGVDSLNVATAAAIAFYIGKNTQN